jgi:Tfp pilus assembly protein PilP
MFGMSIGYKKSDAKIAKYCALFLGIFCAFSNKALSVSQESIKPAGNIPNPGGDSDAKSLAKVQKGDPLNGATTGNPGDEARASSDDMEASWDSFNEASGKGVAAEITKGVRVEDIVEPPAEYHFASFGKQDPFIPPILPSNSKPGETAATAGSLEVPIVSALQRFSLDNLMVVGIWQLSNGDRKAMVLTPPGETGGGQGIIVKIGDPIGNRGGRILAIGGDFLTVREFYLAPDGTRQFEDRRLPMTVTPADQRPARLVFKPGETQPKRVLEGEEFEVGTGSQENISKDADAKKTTMTQVPPPRSVPPGVESNSVPRNIGNGSQNAPSQNNGSNPRGEASSTINAANPSKDSLPLEEISAPAGDLKGTSLPLPQNSPPATTSSLEAQSGATPTETIPELSDQIQNAQLQPNQP